MCEISFASYVLHFNSLFWCVFVIAGDWLWIGAKRRVFSRRITPENAVASSGVCEAWRTKKSWSKTIDQTTSWCWYCLNPAHALNEMNEKKWWWKLTCSDKKNPNDLLYTKNNYITFDLSEMKAKINDQLVWLKNLLGFFVWSAVCESLHLTLQTNEAE